MLKALLRSRRRGIDSSVISESSDSENPPTQQYEVWQPELVQVPSDFQRAWRFCEEVDGPDLLLTFPHDFSLAAYVKASSLDEVFRIMNATDPEVSIRQGCLRPVAELVRSCSVGDIIVSAEGMIHTVKGIGFTTKGEII